MKSSILGLSAAAVLGILAVLVPANTQLINAPKVNRLRRGLAVQNVVDNSLVLHNAAEDNNLDLEVHNVADRNLEFYNVADDNLALQGLSMPLCLSFSMYNSFLKASKSKGGDEGKSDDFGTNKIMKRKKNGSYDMPKMPKSKKAKSTHDKHGQMFPDWMDKTSEFNKAEFGKATSTDGSVADDNIALQGFSMPLCLSFSMDNSFFKASDDFGTNMITKRKKNGSSDMSKMSKSKSAKFHSGDGKKDQIFPDWMDKTSDFNKARFKDGDKALSYNFGPNKIMKRKKKGSYDMMSKSKKAKPTNGKDDQMFPDWMDKTSEFNNAEFGNHYIIDEMFPEWVYKQSNHHAKD